MNASIPSLREILGDGARADGFEDFVRESLAAEHASKDPGVAATHRIIRTLTVAMIEAGRIEDAAGSDPVETVMRLARGQGVAMMAAMIGKGRDDMPLDDAVEQAVLLFREGAEWFVRHQRHIG